MTNLVDMESAVDIILLDFRKTFVIVSYGFRRFLSFQPNWEMWTVLVNYEVSGELARHTGIVIEVYSKQFQVAYLSGW